MLYLLLTTVASSLSNCTTESCPYVEGAHHGVTCSGDRFFGCVCVDTLTWASSRPPTAFCFPRKGFMTWDPTLYPPSACKPPASRCLGVGAAPHGEVEVGTFTDVSAALRFFAATWREDAAVAAHDVWVAFLANTSDHGSGSELATAQPSGAACGVGFSGILCGMCDSGYFDDVGQQCTACESNSFMSLFSVAWLIGIALAVFALGVATVFVVLFTKGLLNRLLEMSTTKKVHDAAAADAAATAAVLSAELGSGGADAVADASACAAGAGETAATASSAVATLGGAELNAELNAEGGSATGSSAVLARVIVAAQEQLPATRARICPTGRRFLFLAAVKHAAQLSLWSLLQLQLIATTAAAYTGETSGLISLFFQGLKIVLLNFQGISGCEGGDNYWVNSTMYGFTLAVLFASALMCSKRFRLEACVRAPPANDPSVVAMVAAKASVDGKAMPGLKPPCLTSLKTFLTDRVTPMIRLAFFMYLNVIYAFVTMSALRSVNCVALVTNRPSSMGDGGQGGSLFLESNENVRCWTPFGTLAEQSLFWQQILATITLIFYCGGYPVGSFLFLSFQFIMTSSKGGADEDVGGGVMDFGEKGLLENGGGGGGGGVDGVLTAGDRLSTMSTASNKSSASTGSTASSRSSIINEAAARTWNGLRVITGWDELAAKKLRRNEKQASSVSSTGSSGSRRRSRGGSSDSEGSVRLGSFFDKSAGSRPWSLESQGEEPMRSVSPAGLGPLPPRLNVPKRSTASLPSYGEALGLHAQLSMIGEESRGSQLSELSQVSVRTRLGTEDSTATAMTSAEDEDETESVSELGLGGLGPGYSGANASRTRSGTVPSMVGRREAQSRSSFLPSLRNLGLLSSVTDTFTGRTRARTTIGNEKTAVMHDHGLAESAGGEIANSIGGTAGGGRARATTPGGASEFDFAESGGAVLNRTPTNMTQTAGAMLSKAQQSRRANRASLFLPVHQNLARKRTKAMAYRHFFDNDYRPQYFWFRQLHFLVLFALNVLQTFLSGIPCSAWNAVPLFVGTQCILFFYIALLVLYQPMLHDESWKLPTKIGTITVCSVVATLNFVATLQHGSCVGAPVDAVAAAAGTTILSGVFIGSTIFFAILMFFAFVMMLILGGDDLISRSIRVFIVLICWCCRWCISGCFCTDDDDDDDDDSFVVGEVDFVIPSNRPRASTRFDGEVNDPVIDLYAADGSLDLSSGPRSSIDLSVASEGSRRWSVSSNASNVSIDSTGGPGSSGGSGSGSGGSGGSKGGPPLPRRKPRRERRVKMRSVRIKDAFTSLAADLSDAAARKRKEPLLRKLQPKGRSSSASDHATKQRAESIPYSKKYLRRAETQHAFDEIESVLAADFAAASAADFAAAAAGRGRSRVERRATQPPESSSSRSPPRSSSSSSRPRSRSCSPQRSLGDAAAAAAAGGGGGGAGAEDDYDYLPPPMTPPPLGRLEPLQPLQRLSPSQPIPIARGGGGQRRKSLTRILSEQSLKLTKSWRVKRSDRNQTKLPSGAFAQFEQEMARFESTSDSRDNSMASRASASSGSSTGAPRALGSCRGSLAETLAERASNENGSGTIMEL